MVRTSDEQFYSSLIFFVLGFFTCGMFWIFNRKLYDRPKVNRKARRLARMSCIFCMVWPFVVVIGIVLCIAAYASFRFKWWGEGIAKEGIT